MIVGPLLLELGVHPLISAATSSLMVLFSASSAMLSFAFDGTLNLQFALIFGLSCLGSSIIGVGAISRIVKKSGKVRQYLESNLNTPPSSCFSRLAATSMPVPQSSSCAVMYTSRSVRTHFVEGTASCCAYFFHAECHLAKGHTFGLGYCYCS